MKTKNLLLLLICLSINVQAYSTNKYSIINKSFKLHNAGKFDESQILIDPMLNTSETDLESMVYKAAANWYSFWNYKEPSFSKFNINKAYIFAIVAVDTYRLVISKYPEKYEEIGKFILTLSDEIEKFRKEYPGCENGTYVSQKNASTNSINPTTEVQNSPNASSNTQFDKPITKQEIINDSLKQITKPTSERTFTITVNGSGKTLDEAKQSALRSAIEQAFGTFISAKTEILNDSLVKDEIISITNGNIERMDILNETKINDNSYMITLNAVVSVNKLIKYCESKGVNVEFKGSLFAFNINQQILNEKNEIVAIENMIKVLKEIAKNSFEYQIETFEPISVNNSNDFWEIPIKVIVNTNSNFNNIPLIISTTLKGIGLTNDQINNYKSQNKITHPITFAANESEYNQFFLRNEKSIKLLIEFICSLKDNVLSFSIDNGVSKFSLNKTNNYCSAQINDYAFRVLLGIKGDLSIFEGDNSNYWEYKNLKVNNKKSEADYRTKIVDLPISFYEDYKYKWGSFNFAPSTFYYNSQTFISQNSSIVNILNPNFKFIDKILNNIAHDSTTQNSNYDNKANLGVVISFADIKSGNNIVNIKFDQNLKLEEINKISEYSISAIK